MHSTEERRMHITGYFRVRINTYQGRWGALKFGACVMTTAASASAPRESESCTRRQARAGYWHVRWEVQGRAITLDQQK
eukprot:1138374-Pelagomonas_calceolata.AAC.6